MSIAEIYVYFFWAFIGGMIVDRALTIVFTRKYPDLTTAGHGHMVKPKP